MARPAGSPAAPATLPLRRVAIDTYRENVAYLHRDCPVYRAEGFQALAKVEIELAGGNGGRPILAVLNVVDDEAVCPPGALGLAEQAFGVTPFPWTVHYLGGCAPSTRSA